jgi:RNA polymerase sigma factor (sigma-70 family)
LLSRLGRRQRAVVVLRFYFDHSVEETAELLGVTTGTVKSQSARALEALRALSYATRRHQ